MPQSKTREAGMVAVVIAIVGALFLLSLIGPYLAGDYSHTATFTATATSTVDPSVGCPPGEYLTTVAEPPFTVTCAPLSTVPYLWLVNDSCGFNAGCTSGGTYTAWPLVSGVPQYSSADCGALFTEMTTWLNTGLGTKHDAGAFVRGGNYSCTTTAYLQVGQSTLFLQGANQNATRLNFDPSSTLQYGIVGAELDNLGLGANSHVQTAVECPIQLSYVTLRWSNDTAGNLGYNMCYANADVLATENDGALGGPQLVVGMNTTQGLQDVLHFHCDYCAVGLEVSSNASQFAQLAFSNNVVDIKFDNATWNNEMANVLDATALNNVPTIQYYTVGTNDVVTGATGVVPGCSNSSFIVNPAADDGYGTATFTNHYGSELTMFLSTGYDYNMTLNGGNQRDGTSNLLINDAIVSPPPFLPITLNAGDNITIIPYAHPVVASPVSDGILQYASCVWGA